MALTQISTAGVKDDAVTTAKIADLVVTVNELAATSVTNAKVATDAIGAGNLQSNAVETAKILNANVTTDKIANGAVTTAKIADDAVTGVKIASEIDNSHITSSANIAGSKLADNSVTLAKLTHGDGSSDGKFLRANNGADPSFETVTSTTINGNADNRVITGSGSANTLNGESNVTINSDGDLLVGRTTTIDTSECFGIKGPNGDHATFGITTDGTTNFGIIAFNDNDANFRGQIRYSHSSDVMQFHTAGSERINLSADGLKFNGDTAAANALDDYEEGTYTAHFNVEGQSNMSMSGRVGLYVKVGQMVTVMGGGTCSGVGGANTGTAIQFTNLPFPAHNTSSGFGHPFPVKLYNLDSSGLSNMSGSQPYSFLGRLFTDNTGGRIEGEKADGAQNAVNSALCLSSNSEIQYMFTYRTDA